MLVAMFASLSIARADLTDGNATRFRITVLGLTSHDDYDYVYNGASNLNGVSDFTLDRIANGYVVFTGYISNNEDMFKSDIQDMVSDRFSYSDSDAGNTLEITLKKL